MSYKRFPLNYKLIFKINSAHILLTLVMAQFKTIGFLLLYFLCSGNAEAQSWINTPGWRNRLADVDTRPLNFYEIRDAFTQYCKKQAAAYKLEEGDQVRGYNQFKRWEWFQEQRLYPSGEFPLQSFLWAELDRYNQLWKGTAANNNPAVASISSQWYNLPFTYVPAGSSAGMGRINCMAFMPGNPNTIFVGAATGGIWKSNDNGANWICLNTDLLPSMSITEIVINPADTNELFIATGDMFAGFPGVGKSLQGHFSAGILKSSDGGQSWGSTGLSFAQNQLEVPQRMLMHPVNTDTLLVASFNGIWRTLDGGNNWLKIKSGIYFSMEFNPKQPNIVFATDINGLWRSNDCGTSWQYKGGAYPNSGSVRVTLAISNADTSIVYLWGQGGAFKKYNTVTNSFTLKTSPDAKVLPYGLYDRGVSVSPSNVNEVFVAGTLAGKSTDGGGFWNVTADYTDHLAANYIHQDVKKIYFRPGISSTVYALTDGGIFVSNNSGSTWSNLSQGLQISEIYRIANHPFSADTLYYGTQDCASNRYTFNSAGLKMLSSGDGMQPLFDFHNPRIQFTCKPSGNMQKSTDWGETFTVASAGNASWVSSYVMNPLNPETMYCGTWLGVRKSFDEGTFLSWFSVSAGVIDTVHRVAVTMADTSVVYAAKFGKLVTSIDGGANWTDITSGLPVTAAAISDIVVSPSDSKKVFVTFSGYSSSDKVYLSKNGGMTWINYSGSGLPNVPVNCITYQSGTYDAVYIGTDFGVFYRDSTMSNWVAYNNGFPNVIVNDLKICYSTMKLRAGTYGRGLWEVDLPLTPCLVPVVSLKVNIEGLYASGQLIPALFNSGLSANASIADSLRIELRYPSAPYTIAFTADGLVDTGGNMTVVFPPAVFGNSYLLVFKHRNALETWSKHPVHFSKSITDVNLKW